MERVAVLLMAHGTPSSLDEMPDYLRFVRGGRPPSDELLGEMIRNYRAIGGRSPLTDITQQQAAALQQRLGSTAQVIVGMRNWHPFIADALGALAASGLDHVVGIPLAPQFSTLSVQKYIEAARAALPDGITFDCVESFHDHPLLIEAFAEHLREAAPTEDEDVIFTAHSLPQRVVSMGDPYPSQVAATAAGVAARSALNHYHLAYQSAGRTPEPWIGPDVLELIRERAAAGRRRFLVAPIGFVCDHTEILFDIDVQAAMTAREGGASLRRMRSLNTSALFIRTLADLAEHAISGVSDVDAGAPGSPA